MSATLAIGVGFRTACSRETLVGLVRDAQGLATARLSGAPIRPVLATIAEKDRPALREAAEELGLTLVVLPKHALAAASDRTTVVSDVAKACLGIPSVAEAAALVAAGPGSRLVVPRIARTDATCAAAIAAEIAVAAEVEPR